MRDRFWKVLLIGDDLDQIRLIEEAFAEINESRFNHEWMHPSELHIAEQISDAVAELGVESIDAILLDISLGKLHAGAAIAELQAIAPRCPIILLCGAGEEPEAIRLLRKGAQDYMLKSEVDCLPLAKALRCAIERQQLHAALTTLAFLDPLTGVYSEAGFHQIGAQFLKLIQHLGRDARAYVVQFDNMTGMREAYGNEERDMAVILATDFLRGYFDGANILGRLGEDRFAVLLPHDESLDAVRDADSIQARMRHAGLGARNGWPLVARVGVAVGGETFEELLDAATATLCENERSASQAGGA